MNPVFTAPLAVRWSDMDINRHVNNARIVTLLEEARLAAIALWLGDTGVPDPTNPRVVASLSLDYLRPIDHGPELTARVWVAGVGRTSYTLAYTLHQHGSAVARARTVLVQMDPATGRPAPLPATVRSSLNEVQAQQPCTADDRA